MIGDRVDAKTLSDRDEIIDLVTEYNRAAFYCDVDAYAATFADDGRYINANLGWFGFGGAQAAQSVAAEYQDGIGLQHLGLDYIVKFPSPDRAHVRHHMFLYHRESARYPNEIWATGAYYRTIVRTPAGWRFSEVISFVDRRVEASLVTQLRGIVLTRREILDALATVLRVDGQQVVEAISAGRSLGELGAPHVPDAQIVEAVAGALQSYAPASNPLAMGTAKALATVLTRDQVEGSQTERRFREAGWQAPM
jgi:hypothetical protein